MIDPRVRRFCATAVTAAAVLIPAAAAPAATDGMIVHLFDETVDTGYLRAVKADGTGGVPLWATPGDRSWPTWSPDGNRLAYTVFDAPGGRGLYTTTLADEGERRVATAGSYAAFSADSTRMAYAVNPVDGNKTAIRVQGVDGSDDVLLSTEPTGCVAREFDDGLFWSAATNRILWACGGNLIGINPDGTDRSVERALPTLQVFAGDPPAIAHFQPGTMQLSPDGTTFAGLVQGMGGYDNDGIYTWRPSDGAHTRVVPWDYDERVSWPAFSGGGAVLYDRDWAPYATWRKALSGSDAPLAAGVALGRKSAQPCVAGVTLTCDPVTLQGGFTTTPGPGDTSQQPLVTETPAVPVLAPLAPAGPGARDGAVVLAGRPARQSSATAVALKLRCDQRSAVACQGEAVMRTTKTIASTARARRLVLAKRSFTIPAGATRTVSLKLTPAARKVLRRRSRLPVTITATTRRSDGSTRGATTRLTLKRRGR